MAGRVWTIHTLGQPPRVLEEDELYTDPVPKANIGDRMATPYVTVRGVEPTPVAPPPKPKEAPMPEQYKKPEDEEEDKPPEMEKEEPKPIKLEAEEIVDLLDIVEGTKDFPALLPLNQAAMINLSIMAAEVKEELDKRAEEQKKKDEEYQAELEAWKRKKAKEREEEEKKAKEKADAA